MTKHVFLNTLTSEEIIKRLKNGEVVKREDRWDKLIYRMIDGVIVAKDGTDIIIGDTMVIDKEDDFYFEEEEEPFEITETGVYKTREGKKAFVYEIDEKIDDKYPVCYILEKGDNFHSTTKQGKYNINQETSLDIVSKWED